MRKLSLFKKIFIPIFSITIIFTGILSFVSLGYSAGDPGSGGDPHELPNPLDAENLEEVVEAIAEWFYKISVPVAVIMILYAAFLFMSSVGNEEKVKTAKRTLLWILVGIAIILIGAGFITLIKDLLSGEGPPDTETTETMET